MILLVALLLMVVLLAGWVLTLLGMPGNWLMVAAVAIYACFVPVDSRAAVSWQMVVLLAGLAGLGEILEFFCVTAGAARAGGSKRGALFALIGSLCGGLAGVLVGLPIPVFGSLVAVVLLAAIGAMIGAVIGERMAGKNFDASLQVGKAAFWGRLAGTLGKILVGAVIVAVAAAALILH